MVDTSEMVTVALGDAMMSEVPLCGELLFSDCLLSSRSMLPRLASILSIFCSL